MLRSLPLAPRPHSQVRRAEDLDKQLPAYRVHAVGTRGMHGKVVELGCLLIVGGPGWLPKWEQARVVWKKHRGQPGPGQCKHQGPRPETVSEHHSMQIAGRADKRNLGNSEAVYFSFFKKIKKMLSSGLDLHKIMKFSSTYTSPASFSSRQCSQLTSFVPLASM